MEQNDNNISVDKCVVCENASIDRSKNLYSSSCDECRENSLKLKIPGKIKLFLLSIVILFVFMITKLPPVIDNFKLYLEAEQHMTNKEYAFAYEKYDNLLDKYKQSKILIFKAADAALYSQDFEQVYYLLDMLIDQELSDEQYEKALKYDNLVHAYYYTDEEIYKVGEQLTSEDLEANMNEFIESLTKMLLNPDFDKTLIYFNLAWANFDNDEAEKYFDLAIKNNSNFTYPYSFYGNFLRRVGRIEEAKALYNEALSKNATDALSIRGLGIIDLLEGDKKEALNKVQYAYLLEPTGFYIADALVIILIENDLRKEADSLLKTLVENGFEIEEDLQEYLDGEISVTDYYVEGSE